MLLLDNFWAQCHHTYSLTRTNSFPRFLVRSFILSKQEKSVLIARFLVIMQNSDPWSPQIRNMRDLQIEYFVHCKQRRPIVGIAKVVHQPVCL